ncbi:unnamed protein product [Durusdinium trenchii]|uniref:Cellulase n=1 Tax=Durusdinium trenchii TaxID=1381693 RepID=A0ABP0LF03_9DINO
MKLFSAALLTLATGQADWCRWVPLASQQYVPQCSGYVYPFGTYGHPVCASWCQWVPGPSWVYTPECRGCYSFVTTSQKSASVSLVQRACKKSCQWLSRPAWEGTHDCKTCEQPLEQFVIPVVFTEKLSEPGLKVKVKVQLPDWCQWVPLSSLQYVAECGSSARPAGAAGPADPADPAAPSVTERCASWCSWTSASSWPDTPECKHCTPDTLPNVTYSTTGCVEWCQWVSRPAWHRTPDCAGCESPAPNIQNITQPMSHDASHLAIPDLVP